MSLFTTWNNPLVSALPKHFFTFYSCNFKFINPVKKSFALTSNLHIPVGRVRSLEFLSGLRRCSRPAHWARPETRTIRQNHCQCQKHIYVCIFIFYVEKSGNAYKNFDEDFCEIFCDIQLQICNGFSISKATF